MSHVDKGESDFEGLGNLADDVRENVKQARIEARGIIDRLEPGHIDSWPSLLVTLEDCLENARRIANIYSQLPKL